MDRVGARRADSLYIFNTCYAYFLAISCLEDLVIVTRIGMAEAARLAIGAISLARLLPICVECIDYGLKPIPANQWSLSIPQEQRSNAFRRLEKVFKSKIGWR